MAVSGHPPQQGWKKQKTSYLYTRLSPVYVSYMELIQKCPALREAEKNLDEL